MDSLERGKTRWLRPPNMQGVLNKSKCGVGRSGTALKLINWILLLTHLLAWNFSDSQKMTYGLKV